MTKSNGINKINIDGKCLRTISFNLIFFITDLVQFLIISFMQFNNKIIYNNLDFMKLLI